ncbi:MAG: hypothetical protein ACT4O1_03010 [Gemmatimonadota bacterium]
MPNYDECARRDAVDLETFARIMNRHFWGILGRAITMSKQQFDDDVRVTSDIIFFCLVHP